MYQEGEGKLINTQLIGQVDHENVNANPSDNVVLKLNTVKETDYYVAFNRKSGFNSGTREGGNQVMITSAPREAGVGAPSQLLFKLSQGNSYTIPAFREVGLNAFPLTVEVNSINTSVNPGRADVSIYECIQDSDCDDLSSCNGVELKLNDEEEWSQVGNTLYDESSDYPLHINVHGDTIATSGVDYIRFLPTLYIN